MYLVALLAWTDIVNNRRGKIKIEKKNLISDQRLHKDVGNLTAHSMSRLAMMAAIVVLGHAAFSTAHLNSLKRSEGLPVVGVPLDVWAEVVVGFALALLGTLLTAGEFRHISFESQMVNKTFGVINAREEFQMYNHRGLSLKRRKEALAARK